MKTLRRFLWRGLSIVALLVAGAVAMLTTEPGAKFSVSVANRLLTSHVKVGGIEGTLIGPFRIDELQVSQDGKNFSARDIRVDWRWAGQLEIPQLSIAQLDINFGASTQPAILPADLRLPVALSIPTLAIQRITISAAALPVPQVFAGFNAGLRSDGRHHRLDLRALESHWGPLSGSAELDGVRPFVFSAALSGSPHAAQVGLAARAAGTLEAFVATVDAAAPGLSGTLRADVTPFAAIPLAQLKIDFSRLDPAIVIAGAPHADLQIAAQWALKQDANRWWLAGPLVMQNRDVRRFDQAGVPAEKLQAQMRIDAQSIALDALRMEVAGGLVQGRARLARGGVDAALELRDIHAEMLHAAIRPARVSGAVDVRSQGFESWRAKGDLRDSIWQAHFEGGLAHRMLTLDALRLSVAGGEGSLQGRLALSGSRHFSLSGRLMKFNPARMFAVPQATLNAALDIEGDLAPALDARLRFVLDDSSLETRAGRRPLLGRGTMAWRGGAVREADVILDLAGNRLDARGGFGRGAEALSVRADMPALAALGLGISGTVQGTARVAGTLELPALEIDLQARELRADGLQLAYASLRGGMAPGLEGRIRLDAAFSGMQRGEGLRAESGTLVLAGTRRNHQLNLDLLLGAALGGGRISGEARGGLRSGLDWVGTLERLQHHGAQWPLQLVAAAPLEAAPARVHLGLARFRDKSLQVEFSNTRWSPAGWATRGGFTGLKLGAPQVVSGSIQLGGQWDVDLGATRSGTASVHREAGDIAFGVDAPVSLGLEQARVDLSLAGSRLLVKYAAHGARLGEVSGNLVAGLSPQAWSLSREAPLSGQARLAVPTLDWLGPLVDPNYRSAGTLEGMLVVGGTASAPTLRGQVRGEQLGFAMIDQGVRLQQGVMSLRFSDSTARLEELSFLVPARKSPASRREELKTLDAAPGKISARGEIDLAALEADIEMNAERALVSVRDDRWLMASGKGRLKVDRKGARIEGSTRVDGAVLAIARGRVGGLSDDVVVLGRGAPPSRRFKLDVDVLADLGERFYFSAQGLNARLDGQVRLRAQGGAPMQATGSIRTAEGVFDAYGQTLSIDRGIVNFQGPLENPGLNVRAVRRGLPVEAGVEVTGTAAAPRVRLVSDPAVPDAEKLSWIVLGRGLDQVGAGADSSLLLSAASAILGGRDGKGIPQQLAQALGFDQISVTAAESDATRPTSTVAGSVGPAREAGLASSVVQVGKRLSSSAYVSYEHSLAGLESVVKLTYALTRRISVVGRAGSDNALDVFYTFSFD